MNNRQLFLRHLAQTSPSPLQLEVDRAEGLYLYTPDGKAYMDLISGASVSSLGHCNPAVVEAVRDQAARFMHTHVYGETIMTPQVTYAEALTAELDPSLNSVYFVNSGAEAVDGAMKLAKRYTGRHEIVSCRYAYHGSTHGPASLMWPLDFTNAYRPLLPGIRHINYNCFHCLSEITEAVAAVVIEPIQAESGVTLPIDGYLEAVAARCKEVGALLVFDEIQTGFGKTGKLFAYQHKGVVPDIIVLGKAMGGGMPIAAFVSDQSIMSTLSHDPILGHITTFGGHPVSCAAAMASLKELKSNDWIEQAESKAQIFHNLLKHPKVKEIRSQGLMMAVDFDDASYVIEKLMWAALDQGMVVDWFLFNDRSMRLCPPLIITKDQIKEACSKLIEIFND